MQARTTARTAEDIAGEGRTGAAEPVPISASRSIRSDGVGRERARVRDAFRHSAGLLVALGGHRRAAVG
jgi:hypothetical protein